MLSVNNAAHTISETQYANSVSGYAAVHYRPYTHWGSYPVYICTDKTKKAIDILQALEADGLKVTSVKKFIELTEKIAGIL